MKTVKIFLDLTTKQLKKLFYPYKNKEKDGQITLKKTQNLQNWFSRVKNSSREGDGCYRFSLINIPLYIKLRAGLKFAFAITRLKMLSNCEI